jgi:antitoxin (DNA-binding transcriptional repressor) of toxin-antitoxin stability system
MEKIEIGRLENKILEILSKAANSGEGVILTSQGKPLAKLLPVLEAEGQNLPGKLAHTLVFEKDIVSPLGEEEWEAAGTPI